MKLIKSLLLCILHNIYLVLAQTTEIFSNFEDKVTNSQAFENISSSTTLTISLDNVLNQTDLDLITGTTQWPNVTISVAQRPSSTPSGGSLNNLTLGPGQIAAIAVSIGVVWIVASALAVWYFFAKRKSIRKQERAREARYERKSSRMSVVDSTYSGWGGALDFDFRGATPRSPLPKSTLSMDPPVFPIPSLAKDGKKGSQPPISDKPGGWEGNIEPIYRQSSLDMTIEPLPLPYHGQPYVSTDVSILHDDADVTGGQQPTI